MPQIQPQQQQPDELPSQHFSGEKEDLFKLSIAELKKKLEAFPKAKKSFKDKDELAQRLSDLYHRREVLDELRLSNDISVQTGDLFKNLEQKREIFKIPAKDWIDIENFEKEDIPTGFNKEVIKTFLTTTDVTINNEEITTDTKRPNEKGKNMYKSSQIKRAWFKKMDNMLLIGSNCAASQVKKIRHPRIAVQPNGEIFVARCDCQQSRCGQCVHVAATLFMLEDMKKNKPIIDPVCTSKSQAWGQGTVKKNPGQFNQKPYSKKKRFDNRYDNFDPRPPGHITTGKNILVEEWH